MIGEGPGIGNLDSQRFESGFFQDETVESIPCFGCRKSRSGRRKNFEFTLKSFIDPDRAVEVATTDVRRKIPHPLIESHQLDGTIFLRKCLQVEIQNPEASGLHDLEIPVKIKTVVPFRIFTRLREQVGLNIPDRKA